MSNSTTNPPIPDDPTQARSNSFFNAGGSTLILAFLAIGLFIGGLLVMLSMRRYVWQTRRRMRRWAGQGAQPWDWDEMLGPAPAGMNAMRRQKDFMMKPELWDVHASQAHKGGWEDIMPISAKMVIGDTALSYQGHATENIPVSAAARGQSSRLGFLYPFRVGLNDFIVQISPMRYRPRYRNDTLTSSRSLPLPSSPMTTTAPANTSYVRVAVAIEFPTDRTCGEGVYALGITDVPRNDTPSED